MFKWFSLLLSAGIALHLLAPLPFATPYWTAQDYQRYQGRIIKSPDTPTISGIASGRPGTAELDEYALLFEYVQICDFLTVMQEQNPLSPDYGGMHEGETPDLWAIVETDNTQEAIRVWSEYADLSGDLETYRGNIEAAWVYTLNYPAYNEEGTESDYYRVHNCGWALVAEGKYREVYSDTSFLWYADSCAGYIQTHRLSYTGSPGFYDNVHPLVEGWGAGTLYGYGIERSDSTALAGALDIGSDVQSWIEASPNRLNSNEVWALCGGTALWGICRSVFAADTAAGQAWLPQYLPYMDTYASFGEWNNSWNVWYAHAYHASAAITQNPLYTSYAYFLVDTLLDSDTDNDGGIVATSTNPPTMDQSWVSCYLDFMGLEPLILQSPALDAAAFGFITPDSMYPVAQGESYEVAVVVVNSGTQAFGNVNITISGAFTAQASTVLDFADVDTVFMGSWTPSQIGTAQLTMFLSPGGQNAENDTARATYAVLGRGTILGTVADQSSGDPLGAQLAFYREGFPPDEPLYLTMTDTITGEYQVLVMEGIYSIAADPQIPYTDRELTEIEVIAGATATADFNLLAAPVLLVDDDGGAPYENYIAVPLAQANFDAYYWNTHDLGAPLDELNLFQALVWFTGNEIDSALTEAERGALADFLDGGGSLFLTGQNIAQGLEGDLFLEQYLGSSFVAPQTVQAQANGVTGDPVTEGLSLLMAGATGAGNQISKDIISPAGAGIEAMTYAGTTPTTAAVRIDNPYKLVFLAFGLEGASGLGGTATRQQFLEAVMEWFQIPTGVEEGGPHDLPSMFELSSVYPNPFNAGARLQISLSKPSRVEISIYNILGQKVVELPARFMGEGIHYLSAEIPPNLSSGMYVFRLDAAPAHGAVRGILLR